MKRPFLFLTVFLVIASAAPAEDPVAAAYYFP